MWKILAKGLKWLLAHDEIVNAILDALARKVQQRDRGDAE